MIGNFTKILEEGFDIVEDSDNYSIDKKYTVDYFMRIKDNVNLEELRFY
jgi:hypothetical protein